MIKEVDTEEGLSTYLSTGTKVSVWPATSSEGERAWIAKLTSTDGKVLDFGLGHEALLAFVTLVRTLSDKL